MATYIPLIIITIYLSLLLAMAMFSGKLFRGTSKDYFVASHSIGPFMLLMSVFGTTMTAFALVGSTGKAFQKGVGTYGLMASSSGLIHAACFFLIGIRVWSIAKRHGYVTQIQFFRNRFESNGIGYLLFPILVLLVIPYLLIGVIGSYRVLGPVTKGMFPNAFPEKTRGSGASSTQRRFAASLVNWFGDLRSRSRLYLCRRFASRSLGQHISNIGLYGDGNSRLFARLKSARRTFRCHRTSQPGPSRSNAERSGYRDLERSFGARSRHSSSHLFDLYVYSAFGRNVSSSVSTLVDGAECQEF